MRLTARLYKIRHYLYFKEAWASKRKFKLSKAPVPQIVQETGVEVIDPNTLFESKKHKAEPWVCPVEDDWQLGKPMTWQDHPDYHDDPVFDFNTRTRLVEGERQACLLTKSQAFTGLPERIYDLVGKVQIPDQDELVQRYIMQAHKWDPTKVKLPRRRNYKIPGWRFKAEWGIPHAKTVEILLYNLMVLCQRLGADYPDLLQNRKITRQPYVSALYNFMEYPVQVRGPSVGLVSTNQLLPPFASDDLVDESVNFDLPDLYPLSPMIDLKREHIWRLENITGWAETYSHSVPHTLFIRDKYLWSEKHRNPQAIMYLFAHCLAYAKQTYGWDVKTLPEPVCAQAITSDGSNFNFLCFQLNTMDFSSLDGIKNFVWIDNNHALFNKILPKRAMLRNTRYEDYDPEVVQKILGLYINGAELTRENIFDVARRELAQMKA